MVDGISKIVDFNAKRSKKALAQSLPAPIEAIRAKLVLFLGERLGGILDDVDDALFSMADASRSHAEQHQKFESMRELRIARHQLETDFADLLAQGFYTGANGDLASQSPAHSRATLELLESDAMEEVIALETMVNKAERKFMQELWMLCTAWQQCAGGSITSAKELAVGPAKIAAALAGACKGLKIDVEAKLVLLKYFDQQLISQFDHVYRALLPVLEQHGLPAERLQETAKNAGSQAAFGLGAEAISEATALVISVFSAIDQLLTPIKGGDNQQSSVSKPSFMVALQDMQNEQFSKLSVASSLDGVSDEDLMSLASGLVTRLEKINRVDSDDSSALSQQRDQDAIQFVSGLFQYILESDELAEPLKGLIVRLQIPILKMAMIDRNFFSSDEHPARKFLSALVGAGIGWSPVGAYSKDPLYKKMESVVMKVLRDFGVDTQLFVDVFDEFSQFHEKALRRAQLVARRTVDSEDKRAAAAEAREYIANYIEAAVATTNPPELVKEILTDGWAKVLFLACIQHGVEGDEFLADLRSVDKLLWSVAPLTDAEHRNALITDLPQLIDTLRSGFVRASLSSLTTKVWLEQLEIIHLDKLSREPVAQPEPQPESTELASQQNADLGLEGDVMSQLEELEAMLSKNLGDDIVDDAPAKELAPEETAIEVLAEAEVQTHISSLRVGTWVDFRQADGVLLRCRLAAVINGIGKYIFVNRAGIKVAEFDLPRLERVIREKQLFLIEDDRLFDRALESVINNLRDMKDKPIR